MKHMSLIFVFALMTFVTGCQDSKTKKSSSSSSQLNCSANPSQYGCPSYCTYYPGGLGCNGSTTGSTTSGTTGSVDCSTPTNYFQNSSCPGYAQCMSNPSVSTSCSNYPGTTGGSTNPFPNYSSFYADKNWQVKYPYYPNSGINPTTGEMIPVIQNCPAPTTPSGISYTPYETRKGTVTVVGKGTKNADPMSWYDPRSYNAISDDRTSPLLRNVDEALKFFYTDSRMRVRIKANLQPDSSSSNPYCYGRVTGQAWIKGYTRLRLDLYLIGVSKDTNGNVTTYHTPELLIPDMTIGINNCSSVLDLASFNGPSGVVNYPSKYPDGFFLQIRNVRGNQNYSPGGTPGADSYNRQMAYDQWGFWPHQYYNGLDFTMPIRSNDCWSVDIEVAADGTKTF